LPAGSAVENEHQLARCTEADDDLGPVGVVGGGPGRWRRRSARPASLAAAARRCHPCRSRGQVGKMAHLRCRAPLSATNSDRGSDGLGRQACFAQGAHGLPALFAGSCSRAHRNPCRVGRAPRVPPTRRTGRVSATQCVRVTGSSWARSPCRRDWGHRLRWSFLTTFQVVHDRLSDRPRWSNPMARVDMPPRIVTMISRRCSPRHAASVSG